MKTIMDGCTAAAYVAYAMSDVATIYPITPIASMGQTARQWGMQGRVNYAGQPMRVEEMESELGAAGATHGALAAGGLATTFTNSQGLLLMLPNMYKIAGNRLPAVFHVGTRSLATHALSIFGDHQDIMAARATGFAFLGSCSVQEVMDLAVVAHLAALEGLMPVCHFFDGWRTSNELQTIDTIPYDTIFQLIDRDAVRRFRASALNPEHPSLAGSCQNPDVYFQNVEAANRYYDRFPDIVQKHMDRVAAVTGRGYKLYEYHGAPDADAVVVSMGSSCQVIRQAVDCLNGQGYKTGHVTVRLFRPFSAAHLLAAIPQSARIVAVLDRTKEHGAGGEPLFKDVATAVATSDRAGRLRVIGGRYGLSSKDFTPAMAKAVFVNAMSDAPRNNFTVGIDDDVTHLSLPVGEADGMEPSGVYRAIFFGMGSDGTVGAAKQAAGILGGTEGLYSQAFFSYSAKKSGGYTVSELRVGHNPVAEAYRIEHADLVCCNKDTYVNKFAMADRLRTGGVFLLNTSWSADELDSRLPAPLKRELAAKEAVLYIVDAQSIARKYNLGVRINTIMEAVFFKLAGIIPYNDALAQLQAQIKRDYAHEGGDMVNRNLAAVGEAADVARKVTVPAEWATAQEPQMPGYAPRLSGCDTPRATFVKKIAGPCLAMKGGGLPVSLFRADGRMPMGTTAFEKRGIALAVPKWDPDKCVQCTECSLVCPHAAIRPYVISADEMTGAPEGMDTIPFKEGKEAGLRYRIQNFTEDCTGCASCATVCPGKALTMTPISEMLQAQAPFLDFCSDRVAPKTAVLPRFTVNGSQMHRPLMQFSGACGGCGQTPYVKLLTQLFGERMLIANATGCSSVWGANFPSNAYCTLPDGRGPAWGNSLFEDNAEYGYGMAVTVRHSRERLREAAGTLVSCGDAAVEAAARKWLAEFGNPGASRQAGQALVSAISEATGLQDAYAVAAGVIVQNSDMLGCKSVWAIGGDGWAYDIGFAGLDHVLASGENINLLVLDTECYSNTGGQSSKATPLGAVTKYTPDGKRTFKKNLPQMMMQYGNVYVASVSLGANFQQTIDALREAEAYPGPSLVVCYCPCINHGIRAGMGASIIEERKAVECGYWPLFRYNPLLLEAGLEPYIEDAINPDIHINGLPPCGSPSVTEDADAAAAALGKWDSVADEKAPLTVDATGDTSQLDEFLDGEDRYADLRMVAPGEAGRIRNDMANHLAHEAELLKKSPLTL